MSCKDSCGYPIKPAPFAPADPGPCGPGPCGPHHPPMPPRPPVPCGPCPPSQYIGSRYVPIFADPIEWDIHRSYESLTIVTHDGESYTCKCNVGPGIDITNTRYWAKTGAYNAQVEQYRSEVKDLSAQVTGFASDNAEFREKIDQYDKDNAAMKNTVAEDKARVDALAERMATAETEIDGLQATTAQHTTDLADLHAKDEDLQRQITSNDSDIAALQAKDVEQDSRLAGIDTKLKSHDATLAQNTADIAKNAKNIQDNAVNIAKNAHELADHAEQLTDHEARLTAQHKEITDNHTAIERNTIDIASLRADLTEDEAKIESNRDAIAHIQEKDVQQDGRLDALEKRATGAETRLDGLDTKTDATNTALTAEVERAKAAELANGKLIANNAAELADHAEELADHGTRITALEGDNATNKTDIVNIKAKNTAQDTAIQQNRDAIAHVTESLTGYVKTETYTAGQAAQDEATAAVKATADKAAADIGDWDTAHPGQTIAQCATSQESELAEHAGQIATLESDKADKSQLNAKLDADALKPFYTMKFYVPLPAPFLYSEMDDPTTPSLCVGYFPQKFYKSTPEIHNNTATGKELYLIGLAVYPLTAGSNAAPTRVVALKISSLSVQRSIESTIAEYDVIRWYGDYEATENHYTGEAGTITASIPTSATIIPLGTILSATWPDYVAATSGNELRWTTSIGTLPFITFDPLNA